MAAQHLDRCAQLCRECAAECEQTAMSIHNHQGMEELEQICFETRDICDACLADLERESVEPCTECAETCDRCAAACEAFPKSARCHACANECRRCAEECRAVAETAAR